MSTIIFEKQRENLVQALISRGILRSPKVIRAMRMVSREKFLPENVKREAYIDTPLPIGLGQTMSAPHMVAIMSEALELEEGHSVLEVGTGSGYHAAITAEIVCPKDTDKLGHIYTLEIIPELIYLAKKNLEIAKYSSCITVILGDGTMGYPKQAPYDRILVTASAPKIPKALTNQLKVGGILVIPVGGLRFFQRLIKVEKNSEGNITTNNLGGVAFVPLVGKNGWAP